MIYTEVKNEIEEKVFELIKNEKIAYQKLNLSYEELLNAAATATVYLRIQDQEMNTLIAKNVNYAANLIAHSTLPENEKKILSTKIISEFRVNVVNVRRERIKEVASSGGVGKALKDSDGKQRSKNGVKEWWLKWRTDPSLYKSKADFSRAMLDKHPDLKSQKVIEDWCRSWKKEMEGC